MAKFFGNLHLVLVAGLVLAIIVMISLPGNPPVDMNGIFRWLHVFFGILWIGLLYYLNFVQVPVMPTIPAELKPAVTGYIAPKVLFFFRWAALLTVVTGLAVASMGHAGTPGYLVEALTFSGQGAVRLIGLGMWLALIMAFNVWFIIWPKNKIVIQNALDTAAGKPANPAAAAAGARGGLASRTNVLFSIPMLFFMATASHMPWLPVPRSGVVFWVVGLAIMALIEINALVGTPGKGAAKPLATVKGTLWSGFILTAVYYLWFVVMS